jgi:hypothetical protein
MKNVWKLILVSALLTAAIASGCGENDSTATEASGSVSEGTYLPPGPSREFVIAGGDNTIQYFGREGSSAEREEASRVVEAFMRARAAKNWKAYCYWMSRSYKGPFVLDGRRTSKGKAKNCVQTLIFFGQLASGNYVNTMTGPIDSLRVNGEEGYAQYHGRKSVDWIIPLHKENGEWKVAVSAPINRRR